jgi:hypothetical protein
MAEICLTFSFGLACGTTRTANGKDLHQGIPFRDGIPFLFSCPMESLIHAQRFFGHIFFQPDTGFLVLFSFPIQADLLAVGSFNR